MQGDFLAKIRMVYNQFTKAEKKVADYVLTRAVKIEKKYRRQYWKNYVREK